MTEAVLRRSGSVKNLSDDAKTRLRNIRERTGQTVGQLGMAVIDILVSTGEIGGSARAMKPNRRNCINSNLMHEIAQESGVPAIEVKSCWSLYRHVRAGSKCREAEDAVRRGSPTTAVSALIRFNARGRVGADRTEPAVTPTEPVTTRPHVVHPVTDIDCRIVEIARATVAATPEEALGSMLGLVHSALVVIETVHRGNADNSADSKEFWALVDTLKDQTRVAKRQAGQMWLRRAQ